MDYNLAKQLKDAGFPHKYIIAELDGERTDPKYFPTLSELIEACPKVINEDTIDESHFSLSYSLQSWSKENPWHAMMDTCDYSPYEKMEGRGSTPEEAVAKLWLELNKDGK